LLSQHTYNEMFTMHGSLMIYLFVGPVAFGGLANYIVPLQIGRTGHGVPRLNALSYWLYLGGGSLMMLGFLTTGSAADFGWVAYAPALQTRSTRRVRGRISGSSPSFSRLLGHLHRGQPGHHDLLLAGPGMTMFRMPIFTWNMLVTGILILIAFPVFTSALILLWCDRHLGAHIFEVSGGGVPVSLARPLLVLRSSRGIHPRFAVLRDRDRRDRGVLTQAYLRLSRHGVRDDVHCALSTSVWAHHMFTTGVVLLPFFSLMSYLIAVPTGIKFFNWIGTMWRGSVKFPTLPCCLYRLSSWTFLLGGSVGILLASPPVDFATHDTYFGVAHFPTVRLVSHWHGRVRRVLLLVPEDDWRMLPEKGSGSDVLAHVGGLLNVTFLLNTSSG